MQVPFFINRDMIYLIRSPSALPLKPANYTQSSVKFLTPPNSFPLTVETGKNDSQKKQKSYD